jgi:hypothetical protein
MIVEIGALKWVGSHGCNTDKTPMGAEGFTASTPRRRAKRSLEPMRRLEREQWTREAASRGWACPGKGGLGGGVLLVQMGGRWKNEPPSPTSKPFQPASARIIRCKWLISRIWRGWDFLEACGKPPRRGNVEARREAASRRSQRRGWKKGCSRSVGGRFWRKMVVLNYTYLHVFTRIYRILHKVPGGWKMGCGVRE